MLLKLKNKMTVALEKMLQQSEKLGGVPEKIEITIEEAGEIIEEIKMLKNSDDKVYNGFSIVKHEIKNDDGDEQQLTEARLLHTHETSEIVQWWDNGYYQINYRGVPLVITE